MNNLIEKFKFYRRVYRRFGSPAISFLVTSKLKKNKTSNIHLPNISSPVTLSNFGPDVTTLFQIFFAGEYDVHFDKPPSTIIDCGAILVFLQFFSLINPGSRIIAIEPDKTNFRFLKQNTCTYGNIVCLIKAIWSHETKINVIDAGKVNWR